MTTPERKPVIVATDGSDRSLRVLPHAQCLASNLHAGIELVRVLEKNDIAQDPGESEASALDRARANQEDQLMADLKRFSIQGTVRVIVAPEREQAADTLLEVASESLVLAMYSRGRGGIARLLHGSVALGVLKNVDVPVLLGGPEMLPPPADTETYRLLMTTDLSPDADEAMRRIGPLLALGKFKVTLLYVHFHAPSGLDNEAERTKREAELAVKRLLLPETVQVEPLVREIPIGGGVDTAIMEVADRVDAQAIAMSTHGHSARHHIVMGSVAISILGRSRLPLLTVRARD